MVVLGKILKTLTKSVKIFDHVVDSFLYGSDDNKGKQLQDKILSSSSDLALFLTLREIYLDIYDGQSKEYGEIMSFSIFSNKKTLHQISSLMKSQTYLHPRLHTSVYLIVRELFRDKKSIEKNFDLFNRIILEDSVFNEDVLE